MRKHIIFLVILFSTFISIQYIMLDTNNVEIEYGDSSFYSKHDMDLAIDVIKKEFNKFPDCKMLSIKYAGDDKSTKKLVDGYDECIVFYSSFHTGKNNTGAFESDTDYEGWSWILCRKNNSEWNLISNGYANHFKNRYYSFRFLTY